MGGAAAGDRVGIGCADYSVAAMTEYLPGQVKLLVDSPLPLGETWDFTPPDR